MKSGDKVSYKGKIYIVIHIYESGYLEIKQFNKVELVHVTEIEQVKAPDSLKIDSLVYRRKN